MNLGFSWMASARMHFEYKIPSKPQTYDTNVAAKRRNLNMTIISIKESFI